MIFTFSTNLCDVISHLPLASINEQQQRRTYRVFTLLLTQVQVQGIVDNKCMITHTTTRAKRYINGES